MLRPLAALSAIGLIALGTNLRAADDQPKDVIAKAIKAHGGEEFLTKNKAAISKGKGKITIPGVGNVDFAQETAFMLPDKLKESLEISINGQNLSLITLVNGDNYSIEANGTAVDLDDTMKETLKNVSHMLKLGRLVALTTDKGFELSLIGEDKVEDKPAIGIRVVCKGKKDINLFFDKVTHLLVKLEYRTNDPFTKNEINEERIIAEYSKDKDGVPKPKKVIVKHDSKTFLELEISEVEFLEKLDDSQFKK
jgi:hypothetical protein